MKRETGQLGWTADEVKKQVSSLRWYHTIDLGNGIVTRGVDNTPERLARLSLPADMSSLTVLDVGAWDGFFSFECERRGSRRVIATDHYAWHGLGWGTNNGKAGFELARRVLNSHVEDRDIDVLELSVENVGISDLVLFLGVLYHLPNPLLALEKIAAVTRHTLVVETVVDMIGFQRPAAAFYPGNQLNGDPTNWWGPNHAAVVGMLQAVGFSRVEVVTRTHSRLYRAARAIAHHLSGKNSAQLAYRQDRAVFHAFKSQ